MRFAALSTNHSASSEPNAMSLGTYGSVLTRCTLPVAGSTRPIPSKPVAAPDHGRRGSSSRLSADGSGPPSDEYEIHSEHGETFMDTKSTRSDLYSSFLQTGEWVPPPNGRTELRKFVDTATARFRNVAP
jgi:hypothetical protein